MYNGHLTSLDGDGGIVTATREFSMSLVDVNGFLMNPSKYKIIFSLGVNRGEGFRRYRKVLKSLVRSWRRFG